jgi:phosphinothricin acetyltransferase
MRLRLATAADAEQVAAIYRPAVVERATSFELEPPGGAEMAERIMQTLRRTPWLVAAAAGGPSGRLLGYAYAGMHMERAAYQWSVDVSAYVSASAQGKGVGRALYQALFAVLRLQGFRNAYAGITLPNPASEGLHKALGFEPVGVYRRVGYKFGKWHDVAWFALALGAHDSEPPAPRALPEVLAEVDALLAQASAG